MKGMRLGREKTGSSVGKKKRTDKQLKQKHKEERNNQDEGEEIARNAPLFVDTLCETLDEKMPFLVDKLRGCGVSIYLGQPDANTDWLNSNQSDRWIVVGTLPPRRANKLSAAEHQQLLDAVEGKPGISGVLTGVEYGKPPHGENKPCSDAEDQRAAFEIHCKSALKWNVPIVLLLRPEAREAEESDQAVKDAITWLAECGVPQDYKIFFSSWVGTPTSALLVLKRFPNAILGLNGSVTFRSADHLREIAFDVPLQKLVLQSDAPNAPPTNLVLPHSPWTILPIAACVAEQKRLDTQTLLSAANENAARFFGKTLRVIEKQEEEEDEDETPQVEKPSAPATGNGKRKQSKKPASKKKEAERRADDEGDDEGEELAVNNTAEVSDDVEDLEELKKFLE